LSAAATAAATATTTSSSFSFAEDAPILAGATDGTAEIKGNSTGFPLAQLKPIDPLSDLVWSSSKFHMN